MLRVVKLLAFVFLFVFLFVSPAFADDWIRDWTDTYPTPTSPINYNSYDGLGWRDYTHKLYAFFQYDDGVAGPLTVGWTNNACSFDVLDRIDEDTGAAALPVGEVDLFLRQAWFDTLWWNVLTADNGKQYYQLHFEWWKNPDGSDKYSSRTWTFTDYPRVLPVHEEYAEGPAGSTPNNPAKLASGPPYDVAYVDKWSGRPWHRKYWVGGDADFSTGPGAFSGEVGWWNLTDRDAQGLVSTKNRGKRHGYLIFRVGFPYDIGFVAVNEKGEGIELVSRGDTENTYRVTLYNLMPYIAQGVHLKAYMVVKGEENKPFQVAEKRLGDFGGYITYWQDWTFTVPTLEKPYYIVVTANMDFRGGNILDLGNYVKRNLVTKYNASVDVKVHGSSGAPEADYGNNKVWIYMDGQTPSAEKPPELPSNLACYHIEVLDQNNKPIAGVLQQGTLYNVKTLFSSTFSDGGWAFVRLYQKNSGGTRLVDQEYVYFEPNGRVEKIWKGWSTAQKEATLIGSVAYSWNGNNWVEERFNGKTESTYADNKKELAVSLMEKPPSPPPTPGEWSLILYYPKMKEKLLWEEVQVPVYGWREVPLEVRKEEKKPKVRLIE